MVSTGPVGVAAGARDERRHPPQRRDEAVHAAAVVDDGLVEQALDAIAEQRAERLALPHAVEQPRGFAHAARRQLDRERARRRLGTPDGPRCALRSSAAVAACVIDGAWMKPLSLAGVCSGPGSPAGSVGDRPHERRRASA